jgi:hypothetical protein
MKRSTRRQPTESSLEIKPAVEPGSLSVVVYSIQIKDVKTSFWSGSAAAMVPQLEKSPLGSDGHRCA